LNFVVDPELKEFVEAREIISRIVDGSRLNFYISTKALMRIDFWNLKRLMVTLLSQGLEPYMVMK